VTTGAYQHPFVPGLAQKLSDDVVQLHSAQYRNPEQLAAEQVLYDHVIGQFRSTRPAIARGVVLRLLTRFSEAPHVRRTQHRGHPQ